MKIRNVVGLAVAVSGLVGAVAVPGHAAAANVVTFDGVVEITADGTEHTVDVCFFTPGSTCPNGEVSTGEVSGAVAGDTNGFVDGLEARLVYRESCTSGMFTATSPATTLTGRLHHGGSGWVRRVSGSWTRAGAVAVINGEADGVVLVTPVGPGSCAQRMRLRLTGTLVVLG